MMPMHRTRRNEKGRWRFWLWLWCLLGWVSCSCCLAGPVLELPTSVHLPQAPQPYATLQPKEPAPAARLYVADTRELTQDQRLLIASLQGLVNRTQPRIFLIGDDSDAFWLGELRRRGLTGAPLQVADPLSLLATFRSAYRGTVIPDPKVYVSPDIAVDYAGADDLVIATPQLAGQLNLKVVQDLRGRFADDAAALRFARTTLMPRLNPRLMTSLDPAILGLQVDDIIAARGVAFWITGVKAQSLPGADEAAEKLEVARTLADTPLNSVVRGYWWHGDQMGIGEGPGVELASQYGKITTVSDYVANYSVLSGYRMPALKQKPQHRAPALDRSKVYLAITVTDGDNFCPWRDYYRQYFTDPLHGNFPIGWGMGPSLIDVDPVEAQWYYDHATPNDEFFCDVSGASYINPAQWGAKLADRCAALRSFYDLTGKYMKRMDMKTLRIMYVDGPSIENTMSYLPDVAFTLPDYSYQSGLSYPDLTYALPSGQAVFRAATVGAPGDMAAQIRQRVADAPRPAFVNALVVLWGMKLADLKKMLDDLGPGYVAVTPSQLNQLYREANPARTASSPAEKTGSAPL